MVNKYNNSINGDIVELICDSDIYEDKLNNTGWICPRCGRSVSPEYKTCPYCSNNQTDENLNPNETIIYG